MGFFTEEQLHQTTKVSHIADGTECERCGLSRSSKFSKFPVIGEGKRKILLILENATSQEAYQKKQGASGDLRKLEATLRAFGVSLFKDCWVVRAVRCVPQYEQGLPAPTTIQLENCRLRLKQTISDLKPHAIVPLGTIALQSLLGEYLSKISVNIFRGLFIPDQTYNAWICASFSTAYVKLYNSDKNLASVWKRDLKNIFQFLMKKIPVPCYADITKDIVLLTKYETIKKTLKNVLKVPPKYFYFDYETTGLKPHKNGHRIPYFSFCTGGSAYSFPLQHKDFFTKKEQKTICNLICDILTHENIVKLAHNCKFEEMWTTNILGVYPDPWGMDTLLAAHIYDNRRGFTGLKLQNYVHFGIPPYDNEVAGYLTADTSNSFNTVEQIPVKNALKYSALDSKYGFELFQMYDDIFRKQSNSELRKAYTLFHNGNLAFADIQENGICVDEPHYNLQKIELRDKIVKLKKKLDTSFEAKEFEKKYGRPINIDSPKDLVNLLVGILKYDVNLTKKGNHSVDKEALEKINSEFTLDIIKLRQLQKIVDTYIAQFEREMVNGVIRGSFDLNIPISYRSSSSNPNQQNIPIREKLAKEVCRGGLYASPGNKIVEADYGGIEVRVSACTHCDQNMIDYILDETTDMHRDTAADIFFLESTKVPKQLRQSAKSNWVFPQFYGSWYQECGKNLWEECVDGNFELSSGVSLREHLKKNKIKNQEAFLKHCQKSEDIFWNERFKGYKQWKLDINKQYRKTGVITNPFGFEFKGYMKENDVTNYPIQSAAFHCLLWSLVRINRYLQYKGLKTKIIGQVHDSIVFDLYPPEQIEVLSVVNYIGTTLLRETFSWLIVPMIIEFEITETDQPWSTKTEIELNEHYEIFTKENLIGQIGPDVMEDIDVWK